MKRRFILIKGHGIRDPRVCRLFPFTGLSWQWQAYAALGVPSMHQEVMLEILRTNDKATDGSRDELGWQTVASAQRHRHRRTGTWRMAQPFYRRWPTPPPPRIHPTMISTMLRLC